METVVEPNCPATRVSSTIRLASVPVKAMLASGSRVVLLEEPESTKALAADSTSPIVIGIKTIVPVQDTVTGFTELIVGVLFTLSTGSGAGAPELPV
jgi:hypothetical protein